MRVLPDVNAGDCAALVIVLYAPFALQCLKSYRKQGADAIASLTMQMLAAAALCSFMAGYHVHEKSILMSVMLLLPLACASPAWRSFYAAFRCAFTASLRAWSNALCFQLCRSVVVVAAAVYNPVAGPLHSPRARIPYHELAVSTVALATCRVWSPHLH
jgi:hypothetical protein